jgi:hypothetical protein
MTNRTLLMTARIGAAFIVLVMARSADAQISGVVADSIAGRRVPGTVVTVYDSSQRVIRRALADDSGRFTIAGVPHAARLRFVKIGYRPLERPVSQPATLRVMMERLPSLLEPVRTSDQPRCPRNPTRPAAFGLWSQAQAALLGTVLAREANEAEVMRLSFRRYMKGTSDEILRQSVRRDSGPALRSFDAVRPAAEFITAGFAKTEPDGQITFFGPDAEVLLDDALSEGYCLELAPRRDDRPNQAGLRFRPMTRRNGRVDLDGVVWIDTLARALIDIEYTYLGLARWADALRPGGRIGFNEVSPAIVWIDQWSIRMTGAGIESRSALQMTMPGNQRRVVVGGAELARASWLNGRVWNASLGAADLQLTSGNGRPLAGLRVQLDSTDYGGVTDSIGALHIGDLLPGPYTISVFDSTLAVVDTTLPASVGFVANRGTTERVTATVPTLAEFIAQECKEQDSYKPDSYMLVARLVASDGQPVMRARWRLEVPPGTPDPDAPKGYYGFGETGSNGLIHFCHKLKRGGRVILRVWRAGEDDKSPGVQTAAVLNDRVTAIKFIIPERR